VCLLRGTNWVCVCIRSDFIVLADLYVSDFLSFSFVFICVSWVVLVTNCFVYFVVSVGTF
jgi:hypothetical protein